MRRFTYKADSSGLRSETVAAGPLTFDPFSINVLEWEHEEAVDAHPERLDERQIVQECLRHAAPPLQACENVEQRPPMNKLLLSSLRSPR